MGAGRSGLGIERSTPVQSSGTRTTRISARMKARSEDRMRSSEEEDTRFAESFLLVSESGNHRRSDSISLFQTLVVKRGTDVFPLSVMCYESVRRAGRVVLKEMHVGIGPQPHSVPPPNIGVWYITITHSTSHIRQQPRFKHWSRVKVGENLVLIVRIPVNIDPRRKRVCRRRVVAQRIGDKYPLVRPGLEQRHGQSYSSCRFSRSNPPAIRDSEGRSHRSEGRAQLSDFCFLFSSLRSSSSALESASSACRLIGRLLRCRHDFGRRSMSNILSPSWSGPSHG